MTQRSRSIIYFTIIISLFGKPLITKGQSSINSAGDNVITSDYSMTYTTGEVTSLFHYGNNFNIKNGLIQPKKNTISSLLETEKLQVAIFPIPAHDFIQIMSTAQEPMTFKIYNIKGSLVMHGLLSDNTIRVAELTPANYVLCISTPSQQLTKLFIKL